MGLIEIVKESFRRFKDDPILVLPFFSLFILVAATAYILGYYIGINKLLSVFRGFRLESFSLDLILPLTASFVMVFLSAAYLFAGAVGASKEIYQGKEASLGTIHKYGKQYFLSYIVAGILALLLGAPFFRFLLVFNYSRPLLIIPALLAMVLVYLFFSLAPFIIVLEDIGVIKSIKKSFRLVMSNFIPTLGIFGIYMFLSSFANYIPFIGSLIFLFVIQPMQVLGLTQFTKKKLRTLQ